jgi:hypothetical protein
VPWWTTKRRPEGALLREIVTFESCRELRRGDGRHDPAQIKALEGESRSKWEELRLLRAGPVTIDMDMGSPRRRGLYI